MPHSTHRAHLFALLSAALLAACEASSERDARGMPCASDRDCDGLACVADLDDAAIDLAPLPLVCEPAREGDDPEQACERAEDCASGVCLLAGACAAPCADQDDCSDTERCASAFARRGDVLMDARVCVARVSLPSAALVQSELRKAAIEVGEQALSLPEAARDAVTHFVLEHEQPSWPDGTLCRPPLCALKLSAGNAPLFDSASCEAPMVPIASGDHVDPLVVRLAGEAVELGIDLGYELSLRSDADGDLRLTQITSEGRGERLDLNVFYVGAQDLEPEGSRGPPLVEAALERVDEIFEQAGIYLGEVRQVLVAGELPERGLAFPDGDESQGFAHLKLRFGVLVELPYLFRLSAGAANGAVNVFFVGDVAPRPGEGEPNAIAGGIPGPPAMHGTGGSGIVIAADMMAGNPDALGRTLAHELGHYLGLFHPSEANGCVRENLDDTPACVLPDHDADGDGLSVEDCAEHGADNLMFWARSDGVELTEQQREVLRASPLLR